MRYRASSGWIATLLLATAPTVGCGPPPPAEPAAEPRIRAGTPRGDSILTAAREVVAAARYTTLVTLGADGHPQARIVDPFPPEDDFTVWIGTNVRTRKVTEIAADPRVTLLYFDRDGASYVTVIGRATAVSDPAIRAKYWKSAWASFYPGGAQGDDYLLLRVDPIRLEVSAERLGILNDAVTWRPAIVVP